MRTNSKTLGLFTTATLIGAAGILASCAGLEPSRPMSEHEAERNRLARDDDTRQRLNAMRDAIASSDTNRPDAPPERERAGLDWDAPQTDSAWTPEEAARTNPRDVVTLDHASDTGGRESVDRTQLSHADAGLSLEQRISKASADLAAALRQRADRDPAHAASALAAINGLAMVAPDVVNAYLPDQGVMASRLTPDERSFVLAWGEMSRQIPGAIASGDASRGVARILRDGAARVDERALYIARASLCDKVEGFGIYRELTRAGDRYKFLAGRANQAIVYVELDGFAFVPSSQDGVSGQSIQLTQDISLYESGSGVLAWRLPAQDISDFSRNRRRDFFVIQVIKLPATLTVGSYDLKLSVRDRTTQAVAERVIGIDVVADASAIRTN